MATANFRKINIDQYDEDSVAPQSLYLADPRGPAQALTDAQSKDRSVRSLLQRGDVAQALKEVTREGEWPYGDDSDPSTAQAKVSSLPTSPHKSRSRAYHPTGHRPPDRARHPQLDPLDRHPRPRPGARARRTGASAATLFAARALATRLGGLGRAVANEEGRNRR